MSLERTNATLVRVLEATAATGGRDDWDQALSGATGAGAEPSGAGALKAQGPWRVYYRERNERPVTQTLGGDRIDRHTVRTVYGPGDQLAGVALDTDDVLVLVLDRDPTVEVTATAQAVARNDTPGLPAIVRSTRIDLTPT